MRYIILLLISITSLQLSAQRYYSKTYDPYNHQEENIRNLIATDSTLYLSCRGGCEGNTIECFKYARVDIEGNYIDGYEDTRFETGFGMETDGDWIYVDGGNEPYITSLFANKISFSGDTNTLLEFKMDSLSQNWLNNISATITDEYLITYGGFYDLTDSLNSKPKYKGIVNWYNKETIVLDTTIVINPMNNFLNMHDAKVDKNDNVYFAIQESIPNLVGNNIKFVRIIKMDSKGNVLWDYLHEDGYVDFNSIEIVIIDNKVIFTQVGMYNVEEVVCIDSMGNTLWKTIFDDDANTKDYLITHLEPLNSKEFLAVGVIRSGFNGWSDVGYLSKYTVGGDQLWERVFEIDKGKGLDPYYSYYYDRPLSKAGVFYNVNELENGDLVCVGELKKGYEDPESGLRTDQDLWIVKTDSMGCIVPGCGLVQTIKNGVVEVDTCKYLKEQAEWFYTPWSQTSIASLSKIEIIGDTLIGNQLCSIMGVIEDAELIEGSELVIFYNWASEHVYFYEDDQFKILYDFSLGVLPGDTLEFYLPQNYKFYDISSTEVDFTPSKESYRLRIIDIPYISLSDGSQLRVLETRAIPNENGECFEFNEIITGIGSKNGFLGRPCVQLLSGFGEYFRCFKSDGFEYSEVGGDCKPLDKVWFGQYGTTWEYCLKDEPDNPNTLDIVCNVIDTSSFNGMIQSTIKGKFLSISNSKIDTLQVINTNNKVYYTFGDSLHLLYDFEVSSGDTLLLRFPIELDLDWFENHPETSNYFQLIVDSIGSELIDEEYLKRVYFTPIFEEDDDGNHIWAPTELGSYYTEKLGYENFILPYLVTGYLDINTNCDLNRYTDEDILYINEDAYCMPLSTIENSTINTIDLYPNPTRDVININIPQNKKGLIEVRNGSGQLIEVVEVDVFTLQLQMSLGRYGKGIYYLEFIPEKNPKKIIYTAKLEVIN